MAECLWQWGVWMEWWNDGILGVWWSAYGSGDFGWDYGILE